ncbi:keratin, type I cytoskeletal 18 isoform X2 [Nothobranchius furzeri]|uniref:Type I cytoskeletal 18-like n=1 Tax=Nothobranchius furzeri TaxID=105023 RepID=A0A9D3BN66_NOTFU|nr:keratin, type I cytoskeletal 18 isoform X2 [Nothobranchius furzeri]KAF7214721.1 type I cytoskeletal 18-like [Nothobranchius furzeri]
MSRPTSSASVYGGAGGRGAKASVSTPEGLRNLLLPERDSAPASRQSEPPSRSPAPRNSSAAPGDDKQTLRDLNDRLSNYMDTVRQLQEDNQEVQKKIDDILAKRKTPKGRDWDKIHEPLDELEKKINDLALDNAKLLLEIDSCRLSNDDFDNRQDDEIKARKELEKDLEKLNNVIDDIRTNKAQVQVELDLVKQDIELLKMEHQDRVMDLLEQIKDSEVKVEIKSSNSNLADVIKNIRVQYEMAAERNLKEMNDWYTSKFEDIKVEVAQTNQACETGKSQLKELQKERKTVEIQIQTSQTTILSLEGAVRGTKDEYKRRLDPLYRHIIKLEAELMDLRGQVEQQGEKNDRLLNVTMKLEKEINDYKELLYGCTADPESSGFALEDGLQPGQQQPNLQKSPKEEPKAERKPGSAGVNKSTARKDPGESSKTEEVVVCSGNPKE